MCAKKAVSASAKKASAAKSSHSTANGQAPPAVAKAVTKTLSVKTVPVKSAAKAAIERTLSSQDIGEVAGEVWQLLSAGEAQTLASMKKSLKAPADVVAAAIGWLAREDKLAFTMSGKSLKLTLK